MVAYVALLGRSPWALINTYYRVLDEVRRDIDDVYIVTEKRYEKILQPVVEAIRTISGAYGVDVRVETLVVEDHDFEGAERALGELFQELGEFGLDITSGRKALVAAALVKAIGRADFILYMALLDEDGNWPYMMIPRHLQPLKDFGGG